MTDADIDQMLAKGGLSLAMAMSHTPLMQAYVRRKAEAEREDYQIVAVMACFDMPAQDAIRYAGEARACVASRCAYEAACTGRPFMLPWRGPR